jgi:hypothetical protein
VSSQGNNEIKVYDRVTLAFKGTLLPAEMKDCDGLDVTAMPLGPAFPHGIAAFHLGSTAGSQFGFYDWSDIAAGLHLAAPCDAARPNGRQGDAACFPRVSRPSDSRPLPRVRYFPETGVLRIFPTDNGMISVAAYTVTGRRIGTIFNGAATAHEINLPMSGGILHGGVCLLKISSKAGAFIEETVTIQ